MKGFRGHVIFWILCVFIPSIVYAQGSQTLESYELHTETINSKVLNEERTVVIQLPKSYSSNPSKKYPIIYRLDGAGNLAQMNAVLESLQSQRAAPEVIIVAIENTDRLRDFYPTVNQDPRGPVGLGGGGAKFLKFITSELMPLVEKEYRVHDYRVIAGASAGGVFSLFALQKRPDLFNAVLAYSPAVWWAEGATGNSTVEFLKKNQQLNQFIYTAIGNEQAPMRSYYDGMIAGIMAHKPKGVRWVNDSFKDVPHNLVSTAARFRAFHNLFHSEYMQVHDYTGELASIDKYYARVSQQHGEEIKAPEWVIRELGYHFVSQKDYEQAIKVFQYNVEKYPDSSDAHNGLAYGYEESGKWQKALTSVNAALELASKDNDGYQVYMNRRARLLKRLNES
ncbi:hypothetical protein PSECIP111854_00031 [Pseudoalteromonas sp. CIP111854]|uniref:Esterase n=1 Tax=Pseudoalteromonas holothuriae TaxID=2963714 RepID=A0A9W4QQN8_9GAMM|nr:alpha/beta hydrolase-fold protein [Pseudoalteromonas sp. CIP111854]CAH9049398.1 hypothetical protein PSECIP111854_00031 [Pseudoalteromonas sp. CIP111854]